MVDRQTFTQIQHKDAFLMQKRSHIPKYVLERRHSHVQIKKERQREEKERGEQNFKVNKRGCSWGACRSRTTFAEVMQFHSFLPPHHPNSTGAAALLYQYEAKSLTLKKTNNHSHARIDGRRQNGTQHGPRINHNHIQSSLFRKSPYLFFR
ncbi:hypothetical protein EJ110_NYTH34337 [Nymphaea thermarum]|nr:hypothetical protein EJ110_NYTH34337 [Nymphaea thermarum]